MAQSPVKPPATPPRANPSHGQPPTRANPPLAGESRHPLPPGYETGYTREQTDEQRERARERADKPATIADLNLDPNLDVSRNPRYNPELDPPLSADEALSAVASTLQAHHIDTKAYKQQFDEENAEETIRHIAIPGLPPPDDLERVEEREPEFLSENTRAEMDAGRAALAQYGRRPADEHEAGRRAVEQRRLATDEEARRKNPLTHPE